jgi:hypothetical protein
MKAWEEARGLADRYKDLYPEITRAAESLRMQESFGSKYLADMAMEKEQFMLATRSIADQFQSSHDFISQQLAAYKEASQLVQDEYVRLRHLINPAHEEMERIRLSVLGIHEAALYWEKGVAQAVYHLREMGIFERSEPFAMRLLQPSSEYAFFIESTSQRLNSIGEDIIKEKALTASLYMTKSQYIGINDLLSTVITPDVEIISPSPIRPLILPRVQRGELLRGPEIGDVEDEEDLVRLSPAAGAAATARNILFMVTGCNEESMASGKPAVFKTTTKFVEAVTDMMWLLPHNKHTFADFVDCLYWIFYEGAGRDNLRYLKAHGGMLDPNDCNFIWSVKTLRNKWLRHDPEHGSPSDIKRSQEALLDLLQTFGLKQFPKSAAEYRLLHRKLLKEAQTFMQKVWDKISEGSE